MDTKSKPSIENTLKGRVSQEEAVIAAEKLVIFLCDTGAEELKLTLEGFTKNGVSKGDFEIIIKKPNGK